MIIAANKDDDDLENNDAKMNKKTYISWSISPPPPLSSILPAAQSSHLLKSKFMNFMESKMMELLLGEKKQ